MSTVETPETNTVTRNTSGLRPPWKPGESGNLSGRPKKRPVSDAIETLGHEKAPEKIRLKLNAECGEEVLKSGATWNQVNALRRFLDGDTGSSREIRHAVEGRETIRLEVSGPDGDVIDIAYRDMTAEELAERRKRLTEVIEAVTSTEDIEDPAVEMVSEGAPVQAEPIIEANSSSDETSEIVPPKEEKKPEGPPVDFQ